METKALLCVMLISSLIMSCYCACRHRHGTSGAGSSGQTQATKYTVEEKDTLFKIAKKFGKDWRDIARINGLTNPDRIYPGDELTIPS
ncbi:uncharacterized lipoprotein YgeR-like [Paramacrobiotus metropolitanus]|uniref:uncharacterized lipoprotein YgeR-like n=1 Tax=Paramacrobiotus metropolitanus TaxID=2943436 RepID=UPI002445EAFD|nr:uncharacterized lipoprotein YgeR-like [Paramacrobiotus metropolitanus]